MAQPTYYLYMKTHNVTGLNYLGQTTSTDPMSYRGSGKYWKRHINKHGYDVTTHILVETNDKDLMIEEGKLFSEELDVVNSKEWANLKIECGDGGWDHINDDKELIKERSKKVKGEKNPMYGRTGIDSPHYGKKQSIDHIEKRTKPLIGRKRTEETRKKMSANRPKGPSGKKWFNNGVIETFGLPENKPIDYNFGRLKRNGTTN